jgi:hypothetical protein
LRALPPAARRYVLIITVIGLASLILLRPELSRESFFTFIFFAAVALLAEAMPVNLPMQEEATISVGFVLVYASILLFGPGGGAWIAAIGTLRLRDINGKNPLYRVLFNRALLALSAGTAGIVYEATGGTPFLVAPSSAVIPLAACGLTYITVNTMLLVGVMSLQQGVPPVKMFIANFRWLTPNLVVFAPMGIIVARTYLAQGAPGVALFIIPLLVARYSFQLYIKMRRAYLEAIMTLTASLDAKDSSTLGHSQRVSLYAVEIGRYLGMEDPEIEMLRYVGVLHDIGKVGIRDAILKKPGVFTVEEYEEMKRHPIIGANIISGIKSLGSASSWVRHHHERFDGDGFPDGIKGAEIPLGARIIAVADSLDAITSVRPYRDPMTWELGLLEVSRCSGSQFDPKVVKALIAIAHKIGPQTGEERVR